MHVQQFWSFFFFSPTDNFWERKHLVLARLCTVLGRVILLGAFGAAKDTLLRSELLFLEKRALFKGEKSKGKKSKPKKLG